MANIGTGFKDQLQRARGGPAAYKPPNPKPYMAPSVPQMLADRERGAGNSIIGDAKGNRYTPEKARALMPQGGYKSQMMDFGWFEEDQPQSSMTGNNDQGHSSQAGNSGRGHGTQQGGRGGDGKTHGYSFKEQGDWKDYVRKNGGLSAPKPSLLNDLYRNQPGVTMGAFDRLQNQKAMDEQDPNAAFLADQIGVAQGQGMPDKAAMMQDLLTDHLARKTAATAGTGGGGGVGAPTGGAGSMGVSNGVPAAGGDIGAPPYFAPGETRFDQGGNEWRWNEQRGAGDMIRKGPTPMEAKAESDKMWAPAMDAQGDEILGEGTLTGQYGTAGIKQGARPSAQGEGATFTNAQGSELGGVQFTGRGPGRSAGTQSAEEFFQESSNRQGVGNNYAVPSPGYGGTKDTSAAWGKYQTAMASKNALKGR